MNADALYVRGMCLYYQDSTEKAFQHFQEVLRRDPDHHKSKDIYRVSACTPEYFVFFLNRRKRVVHKDGLKAFLFALKLSPSLTQRIHVQIESMLRLFQRFRFFSFYTKELFKD